MSQASLLTKSQRSASGQNAQKRRSLRKSFASILAVAAIAVPAGQAAVDEGTGSQVPAASTELAQGVLRAEHTAIGEAPAGAALGITASADGTPQGVLAAEGTQIGATNEVKVGPLPVNLTAAGGIDWNDAGIGAGIAVGAIFLAAGVALLARNRFSGTRPVGLGQ